MRRFASELSPISRLRSRRRESRRRPPSSPPSGPDSARPDPHPLRNDPVAGENPAMASFRDFSKLTLAEWLDELGAGEAGPGAGSTLAGSAAATASVLVMVARVSGAPGLAAQAETLVARTAPLARVNQETYAAAIASLEEVDPSLSGEQRDFAIGRAFARAALPPLETARAAADIAELAAELASSGDPRVRADAIATG